MIGLARPSASTVVEIDGLIEDPQPRPKRAGILYSRPGDSLWLVNYDGDGNHACARGMGRWAGALVGRRPDGAVRERYRAGAQPALLAREYPDTNADQLVGLTTQYVSFQRNADDSVFVDRAQPRRAAHPPVAARDAP